MVTISPHFKLRNVSIVIAVVIVASLLIKISFMYNEVKNSVHEQEMKTQALLERVIKDGEVLVQCENGICENVITHEKMGKGEDSVFLIHPDEHHRVNFGPI